MVVGLFDRVFVDCPRCGSEYEFQSKGASVPMLLSYTLGDVPLDVLSDVRGKTVECHSCGALFGVLVEVRAEAALLRR